MRHLIPILLFLISIPLISTFFFPSSTQGCSSSSCGCAAPPTCAPPPRCAPIATCYQPACSSCAGKRKKREVLSNATYLADHDCSRMPRVKRQGNLEVNKCNSEELRKIIENKIDRVTAIAKRRIQEEAERVMGGRFNVICARGDLSYVTNTELYCQHTVGDVTCFLFKQLSDVVRRRLA